MPVNTYLFDDKDRLVSELATRIASQLDEAIKLRGQATLTVSGGSTPRPLFEALSDCPLDWERVSITQVDERWVPEDHPDSNARLTRETLLQQRAATANFISMKCEGDDAFAAEATVTARLAPFAEAIDVTVLGMGEDGHTASFFPGADTLERALDPDSEEIVVAVRPPLAPHDRMTLTLSALLRSRHLYLHITGQRKWVVLQEALEVDSPPANPIGIVIQRSEVPIEVFYHPGS